MLDSKPEPNRPEPRANTVQDRTPKAKKLEFRRGVAFQVPRLLLVRCAQQLFLHLLRFRGSDEVF